MCAGLYVTLYKNALVTVKQRPLEMTKKEKKTSKSTQHNTTKKIGGKSTRK